jgi:glycosyltransferase involved in cell wall biosynthesis
MKSKKKRILIISTSCFEAINRVPYHLLSKKENVSVLVVAPEQLAGEQCVAEHFTAKTYAFTPLKTKHSHLRLITFLNLKNIVSDFKPTHIIMDFDPVSWTGLTALWYKRIFNVKIIFLSSENFDRKYLVEFLQALTGLKIKKAAEKLLVAFGSLIYKNRADLIFALSVEGVNVSLRKQYAKKVVQIPLGYDPNVFHEYLAEESCRLKETLGLNLPVIGYFGRVSKEKGLDLLISALKSIQHLKWQFVVDIFQTDTEFAKYITQELATFENSERVVKIHANHFEIAKYINCADIIVVPTIENNTVKEQYGRIVQEAMACGKLVLVSNSGALPERVGKNGLVFNHSDIEDLSQKLVKALNMPQTEYSEITKAAKIHAQKNYTVQQQCDVTYDAIFSL